MVNHVLGIAYWNVSTLPPTGYYTLCGQRRDTTKTNISEFPVAWSSYKYQLFNSPDIPNVRPINVKYVVIFMACNDSDAVIKSVMENKKYHEACRAGLGNPTTMKLEPAWFRVGINDLPKGFSNAVTVDE